MTILVTASSKHGSTLEIGQAIRDELSERGIDAEFLEPQEVDEPECYDGFVIGSAIYMGHWQEPAKDFLTAHGELIRNRPVWLFSSGPVGDTEGVGIDDRELATLVDLAGGAQHQIFAGKLDRSELGRGERLITRVVRAPEGDYRDWDTIRAWADEIAATLRADAG